MTTGRYDPDTGVKLSPEEYARRIHTSDEVWKELRQTYLNSPVADSKLRSAAAARARQGLDRVEALPPDQRAIFDKLQSAGRPPQAQEDLLTLAAAGKLTQTDTQGNTLLTNLQRLEESSRHPSLRTREQKQIFERTLKQVASPNSFQVQSVLGGRVGHR